MERALTALAGPAWRLVVDRLHRLVSFEAAAPYAAYQKPPVPGLDAGNTLEPAMRTRLPQTSGSY